MIERNRKRYKLVSKFKEKRNSLNNDMKQCVSLEEKLQIAFKFQQLPKNSSKVRLHNRCSITGRPKGFFRHFGVSRLVLREMVHSGVLPGIRKASW